MWGKINMISDKRTDPLLSALLRRGGSEEYFYEYFSNFLSLESE